MAFNVFLFLVGFSFWGLASAKVVTYDWNLTWVWANPDGRLARPVIGINGKWPCPHLKATVGDEVIVHIHNKLGNETSTMHWHGLYQKGTNGMDGPSYVTQCPIPPGSSYTYKFAIQQPGTYWYHAHDGGQYPDGLRGPIIIHDPDSPYAGQYDEELVLTFSDWYHEQMPSLIPYYLSPEQNTDGGEPVPYSAMFNDAENSVLEVQPGKTYLLRIISMAAFAQAYIWIEDHDFEIVEVDGIYTEATTVNAIYIATAQRYSVLFKTKPTANKNYAIHGMMDDLDFDSVPEYVNQNVSATLQYKAWAPLVSSTAAEFDTIDEFDLVPYDHMPALTGTPAHSFTMNLSFFEQDNQNRAGFNNMTYLAQRVPTLYSVMTTGKAAQNASIYGDVNPMLVHYNDLVEIIINNFDSGFHIMHLHGHAVQLVAKQENVLAYGGNASLATEPPYNGDTSTFPEFPVRRDTWLLAPAGYTVVRFRSTNPGVWLFHCHMEWHVEAGLIGTLISDPWLIQMHQKIDPAMAAICESQGIAIAGNAAANVQDPYDLDGAVTVCPAPQGALYHPG